MKTVLLYIYAWSMAMFFGAILSETILLYPNIFYDVPASLDDAMKFLKAIGPGDFFPKLGGVILFIAVLTIIANFRNRPAVKYVVLSFLLMVIFEFLLSVFYFWPRNTIMFNEGIANHSPEELRKVADEFQRGHIVRLASSGVTSMLAFIGLKKSG